MASRKEQKEAARAARLAAEQQAAAAAVQRKRMQQLIGLVVAVVAVIVVIFAIANNDSATTGIQKGSAAKKTYAQVAKFLNGIPQNGTVLGQPSAPVTVTYYGDLECPICKSFTLGDDNSGFPQLVANEVKQGKVKVDYRSFCTATCNSHPQSTFNQQQVAAYAAGKQNLFWDYAELFYREQGDETSDYVNTGYLNGLASQIPALDQSKWKTAQTDPALLAQVQGDEAAAAGQSVSGTPTLFAKGPKGQAPVGSGSGVPTYGDLQSAIKQVS